jgi:hypothetical protein
MQGEAHCILCCCWDMWENPKCFVPYPGSGVETKVSFDVDGLLMYITWRECHSVCSPVVP